MSEPTLKVEAPVQAWEVLVTMLNVAVKAQGLDVAENAVYWLKTIQAAGQAAQAAASPPPATGDVNPPTSKHAPKMTIVQDVDEDVKDAGAESPK